MIRLLVLMLAALATGCANVSSTHRPSDYNSAPNSPAKQESLFSSTGSALADKDIERILNFQLKLPAKNRIAILKLSRESYWRYYSSDFSQLNQAIISGFIDQLRNSPRVYDASFLPSMLLPEQRTVPYLREAAARYQADLLLAYRTSCITFSKHRLINPNKTKASCQVEAVVIDVRSGIVPFTSVSSNEFSAIKIQDDINFNETIRKAELAAVAKSLEEIATQLNRFLIDIDTL